MSRALSAIFFLILLGGCVTSTPPERVQGAVEYGQDWGEEITENTWTVSDGSYTVVGGSVRAVDRPEESGRPGRQVATRKAIDVWKMVSGIYRLFE